MEVTIQKAPGSRVVLEFSLEEQEVETAVEKTYRRLVRSLRIPGFRPGKAPRFIVERYLGPGELRSRAIEDLAPELVSKAVEEHSLRTVGRASVEVLQQKPLRLKATVPVYPEVQLADYRSISLNPPHIERQGPEVEAELQSIRERRAEWRDLEDERPVDHGDLVILEVVQDTEGAQPTEVQGIVGNNQLIDELEAAVLGHRTGETVEFKLKGEGQALSSYRATIKAIKVKNLPDEDDQLAIAEGYGNLEELRAAIAQRLQQEADERFARELLDAVADASQVEIPDVLIEREALTRLASLDSELHRQGLNVEWLASQSGTNLQGLLERFRPAAERDLRRYLVAEAIVKAEGLQPPEGESLIAYVGRWLANLKQRPEAETTAPELEEGTEAPANSQVD